MVVSVPCNMRKVFFKDKFFETNKFPKEEPINIFLNSMIIREPLSCPCGPTISSVRPFDISSLV